MTDTSLEQRSCDMPNVSPSPDRNTDRPLPEWAGELLEYWAAERGLPPEPWPLS
jgi:hypothetical protein